MFEELKSLRKQLLLNNVGRDLEIDLLLISFLQKGHVLLESVPGCGKTMLAKSFSQALDLTYKRVQCTPDLIPSDVLGLKFYNPVKTDFELKIGPIYTDILLMDEINRANPRTQSCLLEAMGETQVTIDGEQISLGEHFFVIATQNPVESLQGTFPLPAAQLDRFMIKIPFSYLPINIEKKIVLLDRKSTSFQAPHISKVLISEIQQEIDQVKLDDSLLDYILEIVSKIRNHESVKVAISTRALLDLVKVVKGWAYFQNRTYVTPDDIIKVCPFVLNHRVAISPEVLLYTTSAEVIKEILNETPVPIFSNN
ncbi:MAG: magnesium chelatase [Bacillales bacterium]|jgi:MoxR-like ATPase|nr:magnesium chelatase [Bacillales bacterium]